MQFLVEAFTCLKRPRFPLVDKDASSHLHLPKNQNTFDVPDFFFLEVQVLGGPRRALFITCPRTRSERACRASLRASDRIRVFTMRPLNPLPHEGALTRRSLLWIAAPLAFTKHAAPSQASTAPLTIAHQIRGKGDDISSLGQPWSTDCAWGVKPSALASELLLPDWLVGRWRVQSKLDGVSFPLGRRFVTELTPGARMASILPLPNIGNAPKFELTFAPADGGGGGAARPLRGENARRLFEAFWPDASVLSADEGGPRERGRLPSE